METISQKNEPLNLNNTVSSTGSNDFVLIRFNSSRGDCIMPDVLPLKTLTMDFSNQNQIKNKIHTNIQPITPDVVLIKNLQFGKVNVFYNN